jgi:hypothetical protein
MTRVFTKVTRDSIGIGWECKADSWDSSSSPTTLYTDSGERGEGSGCPKRIEADDGFAETMAVKDSGGEGDLGSEGRYDVGTCSSLGSMMVGGWGEVSKDLGKWVTSVFVMLSLIPTLKKAFWTAKMCVCSSSGEDAITDRSSTNAGPGMSFESRSCKTTSMTKTNNKAEIGQPCLTPAVVLNLKGEPLILVFDSLKMDCMRVWRWGGTLRCMSRRSIKSFGGESNAW